jgi:hypothetical protein
MTTLDSSVTSVTSSSALYSVEKLTSDPTGSNNFAIWKQRLELVLMGRGLWDYVGGELTQEPTGDKASQVDKNSWRTNNTQALAQIGLTLSGPELSHIRGIKFAKEAWNKICSVFEQRSLASKVFKRRRFFTATLKEGDSVQLHIVTLRDMAAELEAMGVAISDEDLAMTMLCSLPESWNATVVSIEAMPTLTSDYVSNRLIDEERRKLELSNKSAGQESAFYSATPRTGSSSGVRRPQCTFCKAMGHVEAKCYKKHGYPDDHSHNPRNIKSRTSSAGAQAHAVTSSQDCSPTAISPSYAFNTYTDDCSRPATSDSLVWFIDTGSSEHFCNQLDWMTDIKAVAPISIKVSDGRMIKSSTTGVIQATIVVQGKRIGVVFHHVYYVPDLQVNLLSVKRMTSSGTVRLEFDGPHCLISSKDDRWRFQAAEVGNLYAITLNRSSSSFMVEAGSALATTTTSTAEELARRWHGRLGHLHMDAIRSLVSCSTGLDPRIAQAVIGQCEACIRGKIHRMAMPQQVTSRAQALLELVHTDVCGPMRTATLAGSRYFVTFIDDFSRFIVIFAMKTKDETLAHFKVYKAWAELHTGHPIKAMRSDGGGEYSSKDFDTFLQSCGIARQRSTPYTPQQNGVAERANRTLVEMARTMLHAAELSLHLWGEAVLVAAYIRNRSPTRALASGTPYQAWTGKQPDLDHLRVFGCKAFACVTTPNTSKLDSKAWDCIFVGYSAESKAYRLYHPASGRIVISRDVVFVEDSVKPPSPSVKASSDVMLVPIDWQSDDSPAAPVDSDAPAPDVDDDSNDDNSVASSSTPPTSLVPVAPALAPSDSAPSNPARRSARLQQPANQRYYGANAFAASVDDSELEDQPSTYREVMSRPDSAQWEAAMKDEIDSIIKNNTWELVDLPPERKAIGCKWVYIRKRTATGKIERYKARLVAKGFSQIEGIDFTETFAPVAKFSSIRALLALATDYDLEIHQMDVKTAFLNGDLDVDIYMEQPEGFTVTGSEHQVCKLKKSLYGLKQAGRAWYQKIDDALFKLGFTRLDTDHCVYQLTRDGLRLWIALYVDDLLIFSNQLEQLKDFKSQFSKLFDMKDLGEAHFALGIEIIRDRAQRTLFISQRRYIDNLLRRYGMDDCKPISTPMEVKPKLTRLQCPQSGEEAASVRNLPYQSAVGAMMYAMLGTRPDIAFAIARLSQFSSNYGITHWSALKRVMRYLAGTRDLCISYRGASASTSVVTNLIGYCDADWGSDIDHRRSITGYVFTLAHGAISWQAKTQQTVALSSVEAEYMASTQATKEAIWWDRLLSGLHLQVPKPMDIRSDSRGSIALSKNPASHSRTKHISIQHHFVREQVESNMVQLSWIPTEDMPADLLTKPLARDRHQALILRLGMASRPSGSVAV